METFSGRDFLEIGTAVVSLTWIKLSFYLRMKVRGCSKAAFVVRTQR
jgi:hypothetical protein